MAGKRLDQHDVRARLRAAEQAVAAQPAGELPTTVEVTTLHNVLVDIELRPTLDGQPQHVLLVRKVAGQGHPVEALEVPMGHVFATRLRERWAALAEQVEAALAADAPAGAGVEAGG